MNDNEFRLEKLDTAIADLYINAKTEYKEIIESVFNTNDGIETNTQDRPLPPYAKGTLDKPYMEGGMPLQKKPRELVNAILLQNNTKTSLMRPIFFGGSRIAKGEYG